LPNTSPARNRGNHPQTLDEGEAGPQRLGDVRVDGGKVDDKPDDVPHRRAGAAVLLGDPEGEQLRGSQPPDLLVWQFAYALALGCARPNLRQDPPRTFAEAGHGERSFRLFGNGITLITDAVRSACLSLALRHSPSFTHPRA
jgi:hypothetical protein